MKKLTIIFIIILIIAGGFYVYNIFLKRRGTDDVLISQSITQGGSGAVAGLLLVLRNLNELEFNTSLFNDPAYKSLEDFSVSVEPLPQGRVNPFALINQ